MRGETLVWQLLRANFVLKPMRNPFKAASIVHEPGSSHKPEWSCSSCFLYAIRGCADGAQPPPAGREATLHDALHKLAKKHKRTQTPSDMP